MYADYSMCCSKEYPYGTFCPCGRTIHIKASEVEIGRNNRIECPECGFVVGLTVNGKELKYWEEK